MKLSYITDSRLLLQSSDWTPLRIHVDYSNIEFLNADKKKFLREDLVPAALNYFRLTLKVK